MSNHISNDTSEADSSAEAVGYVDPVRRVAQVATGEIHHRYRGACPDAVEGYDTRDPECPACQALMDLDVYT